MKQDWQKRAEELAIEYSDGSGIGISNFKVGYGCCKHQMLEDVNKLLSAYKDLLFHCVDYAVKEESIVMTMECGKSELAIQRWKESGWYDSKD